MNAHPDQLQERLADELEIELGTIGTRRAIDNLRAADRRKTERAMPTIADPVERQTAAHRIAIERHEREMLDVRRNRDLKVRALEGDLAEAEREFKATAARIRREISDADSAADRSVEMKMKLVAASRAALDALAPSVRPVQPERIVPRSAGVRVVDEWAGIAP